ncbi:lamin tail domain-containing protein [Luteolibacter marinus]|uniref:lamin tail domain-containing protein n=1 Tax=Luteolibacter marinus TaxID=2776705 RepID=UPI001865B3DC|nr:lamin tail domain-containing protein [Luteolibacter marinus]
MTLKIPTCLLALCVVRAGAQVQVNEFLAANTQAHPDIVDFEDYPDWIELKNTSAGAVSLAGYYLSDDPAKPFKWPFPPAASIPANGYLMVWADGHDALPGLVRPRGYWPWRNFTTEGYHTNFSLSADGEAVVLTRANGIATSSLVTAADPIPVPPAAAAVWKYLDDGSAQATQWRARSFDDSTWASGSSKLGYGDAGMATTLSYGADPNQKHITTYLRHTFHVANPSNVASLSLKLLVDDGAVVYLNGEEVVRQNLPAGTIQPNTLASLGVGGTGELAFTTYNLPATGLVAGDNVLAVEVHQATADSSDLSFDLGLSATTLSSSDQLDLITYGPQVDDISTGRNPANAAEIVRFAVPSPGAANSGAIVPAGTVQGVGLSLLPAGGFYPAPQEITLHAEEGEIRYTLDGSLPRVTSALYTAPIPVSSTTVLRARVFAENKPPGPVESRTYFIGETPGDVPYVSVVADPVALFGDQIGIYQNQHEPYVSGSSGPRDVYKGKDAPGSLEFFPAGGAPGFRVNGGYRIGGENNWASNAQHALNFALRGKYGDDAIKYNLFPGSGVPLHTGLTLREGGDAWGKEMLRDGMWAFLPTGQMKAEGVDYRPGIVFINGEYWGIHNLRARWDDAWFFEHKRVSADDIDHLLYGHVDSQSVSLGIEKGNADDWLDLMDFLTTRDLTDPGNYAFVESRIDIDSFIDFVVAESYGINTSWRHNREFWRERKAGSKWQWLLPDMDQTFRVSQLGTSVFNQLLGSEEVLVRLKANSGFRNRLAQRFAAHVASTFKPSRIEGIVDGMASEVAGEVDRHSARWAASGGMTAASRASYIQDTKDFAVNRNANVHAEIQSNLGLSSAVDLTLGIGPASGGKVRVEGVPVEPGGLRVFPGIPLELVAEPAPGFEFAGWSGASGDAATTVLLSSAAAITANFTASGETVTGGVLATDTVFNLQGSPYVLDEDLMVPPGVTLTIDPGVIVRMPAGRNLRVQGALDVRGSAAQPVQVLGRNGERWGGISFENGSRFSYLSNLVIRDATRGFDPVTYPAAVSALDATLVVDGIDIDKSESPVFARGGVTIVYNSRIHTPYTGDCINVKGGFAEVSDCVFFGNNAPDTDAIDYDGVAGGSILNNRIYRFQGSNSDGVDIGEQCSGLNIQGNLIYYCSDKGFSVGQGSTVALCRNLVVGCELGVGVKDSGSAAVVDQNTFVDCKEGVSVYEKNFGNGGGAATVENCIFSNCSGGAVLFDGLSTATVDYSLSDTSELAGAGNLFVDPQFEDPVVLNFQLQPGSPAVDAGNPGHAHDPDSSRADMGAYYLYSAGDYPFVIGETVVIEEVLANSGEDPDWIELHNRSGSPIDIGGWFLSDSGSNLTKYRIPAGTVIGAGGYLVFYEDTAFGAASIDPGRITPFAISDTGETLYLSSAVGDELTDYQSKEDFGASLAGESLGNHYKPSSQSWNFVALVAPTPGAPNSGPRIGPVVISEIQYDPAGDADSEYFELTNVSGQSVTLYDADKGAAWRITDGIEYEFPAAVPLVMAPGERIVFTRNLVEFNAAFSVPPGTRVFEWISGKLSNDGERLQLARPAGLDGSNVRQYARVDRVNYEPASPWPAAAAGTGPSLTKVSVADFGNDYANWIAATPNPGAGAPGPSFASWVGGFGLPLDQLDPEDDPDRDGRANLVEYLTGSSPSVRDAAPPFSMDLDDGWVVMYYDLRTDRPGATAVIEHSETMAAGGWSVVGSVALSTGPTVQERYAEFPVSGYSKGFFRMRVTETAP